MPTLAQIKSQSTDIFDANEVDKVREIIRFKGTGTQLAQVQSMCEALSLAHRQSVRAFIETWDRTGDSTEKMRGGVKGLDHDVERNRLWVTNQVRILLGLDELITEAERETFSTVSEARPRW